MRKRVGAAVSVVVGLVLGMAPLANQAKEAAGSATISGKGISGTATLRELDARTKGAGATQADSPGKLVEITLKVSGLSPGVHGVHLHAVGRCTEPDFASAGGHFDPGPHGDPEPDANHPFHMGDLPNLVADASGNATYTAVTSRVRLSEGPLSIFDADGTALVIHADPDKGTTGAPKSGVSGGDRVACGIVRRD